MGNSVSTRKTIKSKANRKSELFNKNRERYIDDVLEISDDGLVPNITTKRNAKKKKGTKTNDAPDGDESNNGAPGAEERGTKLQRFGRLPTVLSSRDMKAMEANPSNYVYPFENVVFEGGGNKGLAYCGAVRVLEELGIWPQIKRIAGASAGGMTAALLAVGYDSHEIEEFLSQDLSRIFLDHKCGYLSLLPNLIKGFGWNPGKKIYSWFGNALQERTGDPDITFREVYERYGKELCITVTNLNQMCDEYCHPKTTPDMPVRMAVRMSMAIPGLFKATKLQRHGRTDTFVDGGLLCNFPIHAFDGWWLSMEAKDNFLQRLQPLNAIPELLMRQERFGTYNGKTIGFLLYAGHERDVMRHSLEKRIGVLLPPPPDTKLGREYIKKKKIQEKAEKEHTRVVEAVDSFLKVLRKHDMDSNDRIEKKELEAAFKDEEDFPPEHVAVLFGKDATVQEAFDILDKDGNGEIKYQELMHFIEETGIHLQARFLGYQRQNIIGFSSFLSSLQSTLLTNVKRIYVDERDAERTVGINTGHVGTTNFKLEKADRDYIVAQGERATLTYLKYYIAEHEPPVKPGTPSPTKSHQSVSSTPSNLGSICEEEVFPEITESISVSTKC